MARLGAVLLVLALSSHPEPARATDGALEINQACATSASGCLPGDAAGFPVTITQPGSYRLTSNLKLLTATETAIQSQASQVTIDLNGFSIEGVTLCTGTPISNCSPIGAGSGLIGGPGTVVKNGYVAKMGSHGIQLGFSSRVEQVTVYSSGGDGIEVAEQSSVSHCTVFSNGRDGIRAGARSIVSESTSTGNKEFGINSIQSPSFVSVLNNTSTANGFNGVFLRGGDLVARNIVSSNNLRNDPTAGGLAVVGSTYGRVIDNVVVGNLGYDLSASISGSNNTCTGGSC
jgi:hypothetical protein